MRSEFWKLLFEVLARWTNCLPGLSMMPRLPDQLNYSGEFQNFKFMMDALKRVYLKNENVVVDCRSQFGNHEKIWKISFADMRTLVLFVCVLPFLESLALL